MILDPPRILDSQAALDEGLAALAGLDPVMARLLHGGLAPGLRRRPAGFAGLAAVVVGQQLSTASAAAILARLEALLPGLDPAALAGADDAALRGVGLSGPKIRALRAAAAAVAAGGLPLDGLADLDAEAAHRLLVAVPGIGPWTADVYLLFCLGHADAFPAGDLALQEAARVAYGLDARPRGPAFLALAETWRPWRGVAATALWAYYRVIKAREGAATDTGALRD